MDYYYMVYYQKKDGSILERKRTSLPEYKVGDNTSMGWLVKDIKYGLRDTIYDTEKERHNAIIKENKKYKLAFYIESQIKKGKHVVEQNKFEFIVLIYLTIILLLIVKNK